MTPSLPSPPVPLRDKVVIVLLAVFLSGLFLSGAYYALPSTKGSSGPGGPPPTLSTTLSVGANVSANLTSPLLGVNVRADIYGGPTMLSQAHLPEFHLYRWPGGDLAERYDMMANNGQGAIYSDGTSVPGAWSTAQFVNWCESISCQAIITVPAEIDNATFAAMLVSYVEQGLSFHPAYWEIGNEPGLWTHFGVPWSQWAASQQLAVSPSQYAQVAHAYIAAMRAVDPTIQFIGLGGAGSSSVSEDTWIQQTVAVNGPNLSAVAIHVYPAGAGFAGENSSTIYASLSGDESLPVVVPKALKAIHAGCATCSISLLVDEFNAATGTQLDGFLSSYQLVPYLAAEVIQGLNLSIGSLDLWVLQGGYAGSLFTAAGNARPADTLFKEFLPELGPSVHPVYCSPAISTLYAAATETNGGSSQSALFVANVNLTYAVEIALGSSGFPLSASATILVWSGASGGPVTETLPAGQTSWVLPPDSVGVLTSGGSLT